MKSVPIFFVLIYRISYGIRHIKPYHSNLVRQNYGTKTRILLHDRKTKIKSQATRRTHLSAPPARRAANDPAGKIEWWGSFRRSGPRAGHLSIPPSDPTLPPHPTAHIRFPGGPPRTPLPASVPPPLLLCLRSRSLFCSPFCSSFSSLPLSVCGRFLVASIYKNSTASSYPSLPLSLSASTL